jgi:hypothetical protein
MKNSELVTVYYSAMFGVQKLEGKIVDFGTKEYAQYKAAAFVKIIPKGKRNPIGFLDGAYPYYIILKGVNHPAPADAFTPKKETAEGLVTSMSRFTSFDERYKTEFDAKITNYIKDQTVLMDIRHTVKTQIINKCI